MFFAFSVVARQGPVITTARVVQSPRGVSLRRSRGFTLIELMIVVAIVSVLSMLAVVGYRKLIQTSHVTEATGMVQNIRVAQEAYHSETQQYAALSADVNLGVAVSDYYPGQPVYGQVTAWGAPQAAGTAVTWSQMPVQVDGPVMFGYVSICGAAGTTPNNGSPLPLDGTSTLTFTSAPADWYIIQAEADLDNIPGFSTDTVVYGVSMTNQIFVVREGQ
jgi:type IV pilus assembly protein PilE